MAFMLILRASYIPRKVVNIYSSHAGSGVLHIIITL